MQCPICQTVNPEGARYCMNCGQPLRLTCPNCGTELPLAASFCFNCGQRLARRPATETPAGGAAAAAAASAQANLHPYVPPELLEKLNAARARGSMVGERRVVTMLFCDVKGSTAAADHLDPEEWAEIMNGAFEHLIAPVYRYEGTVARLMGDAILGFFGAPIAHEDDPERAVLAGLQIVRGIRGYREQVKRRWGLDFDVRVGINTGLVVVGEVGSDLRMEYTAMGDAINLAARMESAALPGTVQITEDTYRLVARLFDVWEVGAIAVKGKAEPVTAYRVLGPWPVRGRVRGVEGLETRLVGREAELQTLRQALSTTRAGRGQIVCLFGEAGLGKSRLIQELRDEWIASRPDDDSPGGWGHWMELGAVSYDATRPYGMFKHQIREIGGSHDSDPPSLAREKLARTLEIFPEPQRTRMLDAYAVLLGIQSAGSGVEALSGEAFKRELFQATLEASRAQVGDHPTVYAVDDLQWADPASVELLTHLLQLTVSHPILFLFASRPEQNEPAWAITETALANYPDHYLELTLRPLTAQEGNALVDSLLLIDDLPMRLRELIQEKAEGNPFFLEEVVRTLIDRGVLEPDTIDGLKRWRVAEDVEAAQLAIPNTVQALLMARIDRLEEDVRHMMQLAAVIGRSFSWRVLEAVCGAPQELKRQLSTLEQRDLIYELAGVPELEYSFRHALTREAAYNSILLKHRRQFHGWVGEAMEHLFSDHLEEQAAVLAHHFAEAADRERALRYFTLAGDAAARLHAHVEAGGHYSRALEIAARNGAPNDTLVYLYSRRGRTLEVRGRYQDALANYRELEALARERNDLRLELAALIPQATVHSTFTVEFDPHQGRVLSDRALALARRLGDPRAEAKSYWNLMLLQIYTDGDPRQAVTYGETSLHLAREHDLREELAYALHDLVRAYAAMGQPERALASLEEAGGLWRELGNLPMVADNLATACSAYFYTGQYDRAIQAALEGLELSQRIGSLWGQAYNLITVAPVYLERGETGQAIQAWQEGIRLAEEANFAGPLVFSQADLAQAYGLLGDLERAFEMINRALQKADTLHALQLRPYAQVILAWLYLEQGDLAQANAILAQVPLDSPTLNSELVFRVTANTIVGEAALVSQDYAYALQFAGETSTAMAALGLYPFLADILFQKARALRHLGRLEEARQTLAKARANAEPLQARRILWRIIAAQSEMAAERGEAEQAEALRQEAREIVTFIADHAGSAELRASFLARPPVRAVVEG